MPVPQSNPNGFPAEEQFGQVQSLLDKENDPLAYMDALRQLAEYPREALRTACRDIGRPRAKDETQYKKALGEVMLEVDRYVTDVSNPDAVAALCLLGCLAVEARRPIENVKGRKRHRTRVFTQSADLLREAHQLD